MLYFELTRWQLRFDIIEMWKVTTLLWAFVACAFAHQYSNRLHPRPVGVVDVAPVIVGGFDAQPGQFPHQVSIQLLLETNTTSIHIHNCGGSILNEYWILTAGHCSVGIPDYEKYLLVVAGDHDLSVDEGTEQRIRVERIVVHPLYPDHVVVAANDIALMKLSEPLKFNDRVQPIALPEANIIPSGNTTLSGWGATGGNILFPVMPDILQTAELPIVDYATCKKLYEDSPLEPTNLCTGPLTGGLSACTGDSGGPLIQIRDDGTPVVIGVVSWGNEPCGSVNSPSVYTLVSAFLEFIYEALKSK